MACSSKTVLVNIVIFQDVLNASALTPVPDVITGMLIRMVHANTALEEHSGTTKQTPMNVPQIAK